jgi:PRTRC genetic system protein A
MKLIRYLVHDDKPTFDLTALNEVVNTGACGGLYTLHFFEQGMYLHAVRDRELRSEKVNGGLEVFYRQRDLKGGLPGLAKLDEKLQFGFFRTAMPPVPARILEIILDAARSARSEDGRQPVEILFHLLWNKDTTTTTAPRWKLVKPQQEQGVTHCKPVGSALESGGSYEKAVIEIHSHHSMKAFFSAQDDADETGFRIYAVIGEIFDKPAIRVRVGVYGRHTEIPADMIFNIPLNPATGEPLFRDAAFEPYRTRKTEEAEAGAGAVTDSSTATATATTDDFTADELQLMAAINAKLTEEEQSFLASFMMVDFQEPSQPTTSQTEAEYERSVPAW